MSIIFTLIATIFVSTILASCSKSPNAPSVKQTTPTVTAALTETEARKIVQEWIDKHPFQLGSELETEYTEYFYDGTEYRQQWLYMIKYKYE